MTTPPTLIDREATEAPDVAELKACLTALQHLPSEVMILCQSAKHDCHDVASLKAAIQQIEDLASRAWEANASAEGLFDGD